MVDSPGRIRLAELPLPAPGTGELRVRVRYVALCGSDRKLYEGSYHAPHKYPVLIGHEWVGEVEAVGAECRGEWRLGDVVTGDCSVYCGECFYCAVNRNHCSTIQKRGITVDGSCARHVVTSERQLYRCPRGDDLLPFVLAEPMAVSANAILERLAPEELARVRRALVIGAGGIGTLALFILTDLGVPDVTIVDPVAGKVAIAASLGLRGVRAAVSDLSDLGSESFDLILEASGSGTALRRAVELAAPCGKVVCVGHQGELTLDFGLAVRKSLTICASLGSTGGFEHSLRVISRHQAAVRKVITRVVPLGEAERYFRHGSVEDADLKVVIDLE